jgi:hypothetical protein
MLRQQERRASKVSVGHPYSGDVGISHSKRFVRWCQEYSAHVVGIGAMELLANIS